MEKKIYATIDEYIAAFPIEVQVQLEALRAAIKAAAPDCKEVISYNMPAFKQNRVLVYFAAYKNHIGFYPTAQPMITFEQELTGYKTSKGAIQFPINQPLPIDLIMRITAFRVTIDSTKK